MIVNHGPSHMMHSESIIELYENLYKPAFKIKRNKLGLGLDSKGLLMTDGFTGAHSGSDHLERRMRFSESENVELPLEQCGGWSAKGQPADQVFSHFKERTRLALDIALGFGKTYFDRAPYESLPLGPTGVWV